MCEINTNSQNTFEKKMDGIRRTGKEIIVVRGGGIACQGRGGAPVSNC